MQLVFLIYCDIILDIYTELFHDWFTTGLWVIMAKLRGEIKGSNMGSKRESKPVTGKEGSKHQANDTHPVL